MKKKLIFLSLVCGYIGVKAQVLTDELVHQKGKASWQKTAHELTHDVKNSWLEFKQDMKKHTDKIKKSLESSAYYTKEQEIEQFARRIESETQRIKQHVDQIVDTLKTSKDINEISQLVTHQRARMLEFMQELQSEATKQARIFHANFQGVVDTARNEVSKALNYLDDQYQELYHI